MRENSGKGNGPPTPPPPLPTPMSIGQILARSYLARVQFLCWLNRAHCYHQSPSRNEISRKEDFLLSLLPGFLCQLRGAAA